MLDAYAMLKVLTRDTHAGTISLVVNQTRSNNEADLVHYSITSVAKQFLQAQIPLLGHVPLDPNVPAAVRQRASFVRAYPHSPASVELQSIAHGIERMYQRLRATEAQSFFERFARWWSAG